MIWNALDRHRNLGLLVARIGFGLGSFWFHGLPKLTGRPERWAGTGDAMANFGISGLPRSDKRQLTGSRQHAAPTAIDRAQSSAVDRRMPSIAPLTRGFRTA